MALRSQRSYRSARRRFRTLRLTVLVLLLALSTVLGILHQYSATTRPVGVDALDPFGGIESAITLIITGEMVQRIAWTSFVLLFATILVAVIFRRAFCGKICAFGTLQELFGRLGRKLFGRRFTVPQKIDRLARYLKYVILALIVIFTAITGELFIRPYDPWAAYHHLFSRELISGFFVGLLVLVVSSVGSLLYDRFFCKYLCPMGAFLGLINRIGLYRVRRNNDTCTHCMACNRICPMNIKVESMAQVQSSECINCNLCVAACPVKNTLVVAGPTTTKTSTSNAISKRSVSPSAILGLTVLVFAAVIATTTAVGGLEWTVKPLETSVQEKKALDPADIKGTDTFATVSKLSGIPKEEFIHEFKISEAAFNSPIKDAAHAPGSTFDTQNVRDFVAATLNVKQY